MQIKVTQNEVKINKDILNDGEYNIHKCQFDFDEEYNGLVQKAVFTLNDGASYLETIVNNECNIPIEVLEEGVLKIGVYAYETEGDELVLRYSPSPDIIHVFDGSYVKDAQNTEPITPTDKEQIEQAITDLQNDVADLDEEKQDKLISGENIKTINGESVLGSGNIEIGGGGDLSDYYTKDEIDQSQEVQNTNISKNANDITTLNNNLTNYSLITETGSQIVLDVNSSNYQMTAILKDKNGNTIYTSNVIDLPIESMIVNVTYDSTTKEIVFTLQNGTTLRVSVADLVSGLVSTNELNTILANYYTKTEIDTLLNDYVKNTDYATDSVGGVVKAYTNYGLSLDNGRLRGITRSYNDYLTSNNLMLISKITLDNVITGKGLVSDTDYASSSKGGVIRVASDSYNVSVSASGQLISVARTYQQYNNMQNNSFISKGTLENVITGKNLADKNYVDTAIATAITNTLGGNF